MIWLGIAAAVLSGILMSVQGVCNTGVSKTAGLWTTAAFVSLSAAAVALVLRVFMRNEAGFSAFGTVQPRYLLLGGVFGAFITGLVVFGIGALGTAKAELMIVSAQLIAAYCISVFGWLQSPQEDFSLRKCLALAVTLGGVIWYSL